MNKASVIFIAILIAMSSKGQNVKLSPFQFSKPKQPAVFQGQSKSRVASMAAASVAKQQMDSMVQQRWDAAANKFVNSSKEQYAYDASGNVIFRLACDWNPMTKGWDGTDKNELAYDAHGNKLMESYYYWSSVINQWKGDDKHEYTYDSNNNKTKENTFSWDTYAKQWYVSGKTEYVYNKNGSISVELVYRYNSGTDSWSADSKIENTFDTSGNKVSSISYRFDSNSNEWNFSVKTDYAYDAKGNILLELESQWGGVQWNLTNKWEYAYDANGHLTANVSRFSWNSTSNHFNMSYKSEYNYDANGNAMSEVDYEWDLSANQWVVDSKSEIELDNIRLAKDVFAPDAFKKFWVNVPLCANIYVPDGENWILAAKSVLYYSNADIPTGNKTVLSDAVSVCPNPASEYITLNIDKTDETCEFRLLDLQGKVVLSQPVCGNARLSVGHLPRGLYVYKISGKAKTTTGKLVLK